MRRRSSNGCLPTALAMLSVVVFGCGACLFAVLVMPPPVSTLLVLGLDSRPGEGAYGRTDSILLIGLPARSASLAMLSIPRDLFIPVAGYGMQRINTINVLGEQAAAGRGVALAAESVSRAFGVPVQGVIRLDFAAFQQLVDAVGGVTVYVERSFTDYAYPTADYGTEVVSFTQGWAWMNGETALKYARSRHSDDDYGRAKRQQAVARALAVRLINPLAWPGVLRVLQSSTTTTLNPAQMLLLAPQLLVRAGQVDALVIDRDYIVPGQQGAQPAYERLAPFLDRNFR